MWLHEMRWPAVKEYLQKKSIILLPVGSTEQHGRHSPLGTDSFVAIRLVEDASARTSVLCAPPLYFGWSPHHLVLPGTISIDPEILEGVLFCVIRSLSSHGFSSFIVVNGHRITNLPWIQLAAAKAQRELGVRMAIFDPAYMQKEFAAKLGLETIGHGDYHETSQMLHIHPELVDMAQAVDSPDHARPLYDPDPAYRDDTLCYVPSSIAQMEQIVQETGGSNGQPTKSNAQLGRALHEHLVDRLVQVIDQLT